MDKNDIVGENNTGIPFESFMILGQILQDQNQIKEDSNINNKIDDNIILINDYITTPEKNVKNNNIIILKGKKKLNNITITGNKTMNYVDDLSSSLTLSTENIYNKNINTINITNSILVGNINNIQLSNSNIITNYIQYNDKTISGINMLMKLDKIMDEDSNSVDSNSDGYYSISDDNNSDDNNSDDNNSDDLIIFKMNHMNNMNHSINYNK
jgi:hypothetical protein